MSSGASAARSPESPGGVVRLGVRFRPLSFRLMPAWAAVCGALTSGRLPADQRTWLQLVLTLFLVDPAWGTLRDSLAGTDWRTPLARWSDWPVGGKIVLLPFTQAGSRGDRLALALGRLRAWWRQELWPSCGDAIQRALVGLVAAALLSAILGPGAALASLAASAAIQLGLVLTGGAASEHPVSEALVALTLPWMVGRDAVGALMPLDALLPLGLAAGYGLVRSPRSMGVRIAAGAAIVALAALLVATGQPYVALAACTMLLPPLMLVPWLKRGFGDEGILRFSRPWLILAMFATAMAVTS